MIDYVSILNKRPNGVLATVGEETPQTRIFEALWVEDNKVYFCTGAQKDVYKQLENNPTASFCVLNKFSPVISVNGLVGFTEEMKYKEKAFELLPMLNNLYQTPTNPNFKIFYIDIKQVKTFSYAQGPDEIRL